MQLFFKYKYYIHAISTCIYPNINILFLIHSNATLLAIWVQLGFRHVVHSLRNTIFYPRRLCRKYINSILFFFDWLCCSFSMYLIELLLHHRTDGFLKQINVFSCHSHHHWPTSVFFNSRICFMWKDQALWCGVLQPVEINDMDNEPIYWQNGHVFAQKMCFDTVFSAFLCLDFFLQLAAHQPK
jgi:hypothetical protein